MKTFWVKIAKWYRKWSKSITFIDEFDMTFRHVEKHYNPNENEVSQKSKTRCGNPYKACRKWRLFEPKTQKGFQNDQTSITFIDKTHMAFHHVENPYKTCRKWSFLGCQNVKSQKFRISQLDEITVIEIPHFPIWWNHGYRNSAFPNLMKSRL